MKFSYFLVVFVLFVTVTFLSSVHSTEEDNYRKGVLHWIIPSPVRNVFHRGNSKNETEANGDIAKSQYEKKRQEAEKKDPNVKNDKEEHGKWDFFGRDVINEVSKGFGEIQKTVGLKSNSSTGLDTDKGFFSGIADKFQEHVQAIYPGTKWCGGGNKAEDKEDLGRFAETDSCCRDHDNCQDSISAGETKHGLDNTGLFTRSNCACDKKFYTCLKKVNSIISNKIGFTYFTVLGPQCFKKVDCKERENCRAGKLVADEEEYEWIDNPKY